MVDFIRKHKVLVLFSVAIVLFDLLLIKGFFYTPFLAYGLFIKLLLSNVIRGRARQLLTITIWSLFVLLAGLTAYVNWYLPHGPSYPTGEVVCRNDERGPCAEQYKEDTRGLDIPEWAKFLRTSGSELLLVGLLFAGAIVSGNKRDEEEEITS